MAYKPKSTGPSERRLTFRLEQARETIQTAIGLIAKGRGELANQFLSGAIPLIDRDLRQRAS